jgi:hypothetical protein
MRLVDCLYINTIMEINLNQDLRLSGYVVDSHVSQPVELFTRTQPIYSIELTPADPLINSILADLIYLQVGHTKAGRKLCKELGASDILKLESIRKPFVTGLLFEGDEFRPQQLVTASCRFELTYSDDREHCFVRNILRGVDGQVEFDPFEASEWNTLAESKYGDLVF